MSDNDKVRHTYLILAKIIITITANPKKKTSQD